MLSKKVEGELGEGNEGVAREGLERVLSVTHLS